MQAFAVIIAIAAALSVAFLGAGLMVSRIDYAHRLAELLRETRRLRVKHGSEIEAMQRSQQQALRRRA